MIKKLVSIGLAAIMLVAFAGIASATHGSSGSASHFPAQNKNACDAHGGTFHQDGGTKTCTVEGEAEYRETRVAGKSGNSWGIIEQSKIVYTKDSSDFESSGDTPIVLECTNPGGDVMDPEHRHCQ